jgi:hypothetical protein
MSVAFVLIRLTRVRRRNGASDSSSLTLTSERFEISAAFLLRLLQVDRLSDGWLACSSFTLAAENVDVSVAVLPCDC